MIEILGKVGFDWQVALANFVNFIIIFIILKKFAFNPIFKIIKERQDKINKGIEDAEKAESNLIMAEETRNKKITEAKLEANEIIGTAQKKANEIIDLNKTEALKIKANIIDEGEKQVAQQKKILSQEIEKETASLIINSVEKVLRKNLSSDQEEVYIKSILSN